MRVKKTQPSKLDTRNCYTVSLAVHHPVWPVSRITAALGWDPDVSWNAGYEHRHPKIGALLNVRKTTYWCLSNQVEGERLFFREFVRVINWLITRKTFLDELQATGGDVAVNIGLLGSHNIGSSLGPDHIRAAADLGITLGIEVFPKMNPRTPRLVPWT